MLQFMGSQRVGDDLATEQQQQRVTRIEKLVIKTQNWIKIEIYFRDTASRTCKEWGIGQESGGIKLETVSFYCSQSILSILTLAKAVCVCVCVCVCVGSPTSLTIISLQSQDLAPRLTLSRYSTDTHWIKLNWIYFSLNGLSTSGF